MRAPFQDPFHDAVLYDRDYRRRRDDVRFYATLADERGGPVLDLGCGTGRLMIPLLRAGHTVVGLDREPAMLIRAAARLARLRPAVARRGVLVRGDLRALPVAPRFAFAVAAFHSVQHLYRDDDLLACFRDVARALVPGGWFACDAFAPDARFLARAAGDPARRWSRSTFRHPATGTRLQYSESYRLQDDGGRILRMFFHYQPVDGRGRRRGPERRVELRHRLISPEEMTALLARAGLTVIATWGGFDGRPLDRDTEQHIYLTRRGALPAHGKRRPL